MGNAEIKGAARREIVAAFWAYIERLKDMGGQGTLSLFVQRYNLQQEVVSSSTREAFPTLHLRTFDRWLDTRRAHINRQLNGNYGNRLGSGFFDTHPRAVEAIRKLLEANPQITAGEALRTLKSQFKWPRYPSLTVTQRQLRALRAASGLALRKGRPLRYYPAP